jgi:hypothetical protein
MAHHRYPLITKADYPAMQKLIGDDLPPNYEEWAYAIEKRQNRDKYEDKSWSGETLVPVNPQEFAACCGSEKPTRSVLDRFVNEKQLP